MRGDYTDNVSRAMTEGSHPARYCANKGDCATCISTSWGCGLVAVATEQGLVTVWDLDRGLFIMVRLLSVLSQGSFINCLKDHTHGFRNLSTICLIF